MTRGVTTGNENGRSSISELQPLPAERSGRLLPTAQCLLPLLRSG